MAGRHADKPIKDDPTQGIWKRFLLLIPLAIALSVASYLYIRSVCGTCVYTSVIANEGAFTIDDITVETPGVIEVEDVYTTKRGQTAVVMKAVADGETDVTLGRQGYSEFWNVRVQDGAVIFGGINFSGWESLFVSACVLMAVICVLFASVFVKLARRAWFSYEMVAAGGGFLFVFSHFVLFLTFYALGVTRSFSVFIYELITMSEFFVVLASVPLGVLALLVTLSNISLIRHEGLRPVNVLGIAVSMVWLVANSIFVSYQSVFLTTMGYRFALTVDVLYSTALSFGETLLISTIVCALFAAKREPEHAADYLIILGCGIRADGTPCPLLAGRVDRARSFDEKRVAAGDAPATFVPSGGQGEDEVISEAQSMCDYLVSKGVGRERVALEDRSTTTRENMAFSREVIEHHAGCDVSEVRVAFSTTNYHVFRGYIFAHEAGMDVEGLGAKTKAYFWPNAFLREFIGLLAVEWKMVLQVYVAVSLLYYLAVQLFMLL